MTLNADQRRTLLSHPAGWIACGFGAGLSPVAPGTAGSLLALLPWLALRELPPAFHAAALVVAFALGVGVCDWAVRALKIADPGAVVWDEFVGLWLALAPLVLWPRGWPWIFGGFMLFRIFDIAKPWPVSWADRKISGGLGVMLDDAFAGVYAALVLVALQQLVHAFA
ncbi:MAG: phosphatidylglycerophosphatase A [Proteobacteria bacterium]|nr:phosphatidylglycerophosphatase A [Pseudomonadota bacterium]